MEKAIKTTETTETRENWGSRFGFIMATAGFSIGLGNINPGNNSTNS